MQLLWKYIVECEMPHEFCFGITLRSSCPKTQFGQIIAILQSGVG